MKKAAQRCPDCQAQGSHVRVIFGLPTEADLEQAKAGKMVLGGCVRPPDAPRWVCRRCGKGW